MTIPDLLYPKALAAKAPHLPDAVDVDLVGRAPHVEGRLQVGLMLGHVEIYVGGELLLIGDVPLHRPLLGVRVWS